MRWPLKWIHLCLNFRFFACTTGLRLPLQRCPTWFPSCWRVAQTCTTRRLSAFWPSLKSCVAGRGTDAAETPRPHSRSGCPMLAWFVDVISSCLSPRCLLYANRSHTNFKTPSRTSCPVGWPPQINLALTCCNPWARRCCCMSVAIQSLLS